MLLSAAGAPDTATWISGIQTSAHYSRSFVLDLGVAAHSVAFRSDGKQLAIASWDGTVRVYDASTLKEVRVLHGHRRNVYRVAYSHDCERLVTCGWDDTVRLWDSATGNRVDFLGRHDAFVRAVAFNPDGQRIASGGQDNTVRFWEAATSREIGTLGRHSRPVSDVAFSPDGQQIASASGDGTVKIWETTAAEPSRQHFLTTLGSRVTSSLTKRLSPRRVGTTSSVSGMTHTGRQIRSLDDENINATGAGSGITYDLAISSDGCQIASSDGFGNVRLWDAKTGLPIRNLIGHKGIACGLAFHPSGRQLASTSTDGNASTLDMVHARSSVVYQAPTGIGTIAAAYSPDGQQVAVASGDGIVRIFDVSEGFEIRQLECPTHPRLGSSLMGMLSYDPSGHWIAACSNPDNRSPGEVRVFDVTACQRVFTLRGHGRPVTCVAFSPTVGGSLLEASIKRSSSGRPRPAKRSSRSEAIQEV